MQNTLEEEKAEPLTLLPSQFTLQASLDTIIGGAATGGFLRITLCGFGPVLPFVTPAPGPMLADAGIPQMVGPQVGSTPLQVVLFCNDFINPSGTIYEIAVLDQNKNVIQCGNYQFIGVAGQTIDLSSAVQIVGPYGFPIGGLRYMPCSGATPGTVYTAPGIPIAVSYNGIFLPYGLSLPTLSYTSVGNIITLNFSTQAGDRIYALCVV